MKRIKNYVLSVLIALSISSVSISGMIPYQNDTATTITSEAKVKKKVKKTITVYITRTGSCYHTHKCGNGTYYKSTLKKAKSYGLRPCKKCY